MNSQLRRRLGLARRVAAVAIAVALVAVLPINWTSLGQRLCLTAAGLQQPGAVADWLWRRLPEEDPDRPAVTVPGEGELPALGEGSETLPELLKPFTPPQPTPSVDMISPPGEQGDGGKIVEKTMDTGDSRDSGIATINRSGTTVDVEAALNRPLSLSFADTDAPQVLILHTHTTEGYMRYDAGYYNEGDRDRTEDHARNVCAVGEAVRLALAEAGVVAIHDTTVHDSPVYSGAYTRSAATAENILAQYPTIRVVLDIHRDAVMQGEALVKPTATVNDKKAAQMMLITGVVSTGALPHPQWAENLTFSTHLQKALTDQSPDLMRPLNTVASRYNQHLSPGWVLVEVGSEGNTVEEAVYAGQILGQTLATLLS